MSCTASHLHYNYNFMHYRCVLYMLISCVLLGLDWAKPMMFLSLHVTCSYIFMHTYLHFFIFLYIDLFGAFLCVSLSPSLSLSFFRLVTSWHLNENPLRPRTLFILGHPLLLTPLLLTYSSVMIKLERTFRRTFLDEVFI